MNQSQFTFPDGLKIIQQKKEINSDESGDNTSEASFLLFGDELSSIVSIESLNKSQSNYEDSFMTDLNLNNKSTDSAVTTVSIVDEVKKLMVSNPNLLSPNKTSLKELTSSSGKTKQACTLYQPITSSILENEETITGDKIKVLFKRELDSQRTDIKYEMRRIASDLRNHIFTFQWFVMKEFMRIENTLNKFRQELATDEGFVEESILQENHRLREENGNLKESLTEFRKL